VSLYFRRRSRCQDRQISDQALTAPCTRRAAAVQGFGDLLVAGEKPHVEQTDVHPRYCGRAARRTRPEFRTDWLTRRPGPTSAAETARAFSWNSRPPGRWQTAAAGRRRRMGRAAPAISPDARTATGADASRSRCARAPARRPAPCARRAAGRVPGREEFGFGAIPAGLPEGWFAGGHSLGVIKALLD